MYVISDEPLKQPSQWNQSNDLLAKLAPLPHPASVLIGNLMFLHYNKLMHLFALSSIRNSNKFSFDTLTSLQQSSGA